MVFEQYRVRTIRDLCGTVYTRDGITSFVYNSRLCTLPTQRHTQVLFSWFRRTTNSPLLKNFSMRFFSGKFDLRLSIFP